MDASVENLMMPESQKYAMPNLLLISGEQRNVGKTTLGCRIVNQVKHQTEVIAIKVSPHYHLLSDSMEIVERNSCYIISREKEANSGKDSSRYLKAGAAIVYYIQTSNEKLGSLANWIHDHLPLQLPVVCESGGLHEFITPGYSIFLKQGEGTDTVFFNRQVLYTRDRPEKVASEISWKNNQWQL